MVAKITIPKSIEAALNYNEKKVQKGNACCLHAENYLNEISGMNFHQKLQGFLRLNSLNERASTKTLHVSLNFDTSENLTDNRLVDIATTYMNKIGFGEQPFLVYKHADAGHPHIHIVSTTIRPDGSRVSTHNIGRNQSEKARKEIEQTFGLVKAEKVQRPAGQNIKPVDIEKALYGKQETKRAISNIVTTVFGHYKFTSLPEFNAALKQFNVIADRGKEEGRIYRHNGLVYRILDDTGHKTGVPIKASSISCRPTLANLEGKFLSNEKLKEAARPLTKNVIDDCLSKAPQSIKALVAMLETQQVSTVLRQNAAGVLYGITFVDNRSQCVFNGSDLGKGYSVAALQSRLGTVEQKEEKQHDVAGTPTASGSQKIPRQKQPDTLVSTVKGTNILDILLESKEQFNNTPSGLLNKKRKKKNKKQ